MIKTTIDKDGIATLEWDMPGRSQNVLNAVSTAAFRTEFEKVLADPAVKGILVASAKKDFVAGADLEEFLRVTDATAVHAYILAWQKLTRAMETGKKPVAAALNGSALGGGFELSLGCHYRVAADNPKARFGFPEVTIGLIPGGGGCQRVPRLIGIDKALPLLIEGKRLKPAEAKEIGIIHAVVPEGHERVAAKAWLTGEGQKNCEQPWDRKGFRVPGGEPQSPRGMMTFMAANAMLRERTHGNYPAPRHLLSAVYEGVQTDIDTGLAIEARYLTACVLSPEAKNMIRTMFFSMGEANKLATRPKGVPTQAYRKVGMIGAGFMGSGIAHSLAAAGLDVVLIDATQEQAEKGRDYVRKVVGRDVEKGRMKADAAEALLARVKPTTNYADLKGADLVIEAVFEDRTIKAAVTKKAEAVLAPGAIYASNTSTLPITGLAKESARPTNFIGLHFFSPAERMPLVEVIVGKETSEETLARSLDLVKAIGKTPIVVNDARGFYTSRVVATYINEGIAMLEEGVNPVLIERAGQIAGMPVGPLSLADEVAVDLMYKISRQTRADLGDRWVETSSARVPTIMVEKLGRLGKKAGKGFYDYPAGAQKHLSPELAQHWKVKAEQPSVEEVVERLVAIQSVETLRCLEEKVLMRPEDGDVGAILGWGYPPFRGGPVSWVHTIGAKRFRDDCRRLAKSYGPRFAPPRLLEEMAETGAAFYKA